jgi:hypothetical protein
MLIVVVLLVLAGLWMLGMLPGVEPARFEVRHVFERGVLLPLISRG